MKLLSALLLFYSLSTMAGEKAIQDVQSMVLLPNGNYLVVCIDGTVEEKTLADVSAKRVCSHFAHLKSDYELFKGGIIGGLKFCNFKAETNLIGAKLSHIDITFEFPCEHETNRFECQNNTQCSAIIHGEEHQIIYNTGMITLKNKSLNLNGVFINKGINEYTSAFIKMEAIKDPESNTYQVAMIKTPREFEMGWQALCYPYNAEEEPERVQFLAEAICADFNSIPISYGKAPMSALTDEYTSVHERICDMGDRSLSDCNIASFPCSSNALLSIVCKN